MPKNVLITGATSGIGEATARAFAKEGENLILTGRRVERLGALKEELQATYPNQKVWTFALDVTDMAMVKDVCQAILKSVGQVTGLRRCLCCMKSTCVTGTAAGRVTRWTLTTCCCTPICCSALVRIYVINMRRVSVTS